MKVCKRLKIVFIGNMNNNHFAMARYLRDEGYDCELLLFPDEPDHFHPSADTYSLGYREWTHQMPWGSRRNFLRAAPNKVHELLSKFDLRIGCGLAPALCHRGGVVLDVFKPYGGDLWSQTRYGLHRAMLNSLVTTHAQRKGLAKVPVFHAPRMIDPYEKIVTQFWHGKTRWYEGMPMVYAPEYAQDSHSEMMVRSHWGREFLRIREGCDFMVVAHGRHVWGANTDPNVKGNDILLKGWAMFIRLLGSYRAKLILLEYGENVGHSKQLVRQLGLDDTVEWLPRMCRKDIMPGLQLADAVAGEFVHSWVSGGVIYEALVAKKPLIMHRVESGFVDVDKSLFPVCKASTPEGVATQLQFLSSNPSIAKEMGDEGFDWYASQVVRRGKDRYIELFENTKSCLIQSRLG